MSEDHKIESQQREAPRPRIVVADDSPYMRDLIALALGLHGLDAVGAVDGEAALAVILSEGADGLVSDLPMPGLDGLRLCRMLRALRASEGLPVVIFSGVGERDPRLQSLRELGDVRILHKPSGLQAIAPAFIEMLPARVTGRRVRTDGVGSSPRASISAP
jgi:DNA-binding response OmpR family regulator